MITFALVGLFIIQLISIFVIILLYSKLAKFKDLEVRQDRIVREMDDAIGGYLLEMREENDRFIQALQTAPVQPAVKKPAVFTEPIQAPTPEINPQTVESLLTETRTVVPKMVAANVYNKHKAQQVEPEPILEQLAEVNEQIELPSFEQEVLVYHKQGLSIEDIAKKTQRGKTEIELLIKFHA